MNEPSSDRLMVKITWVKIQTLKTKEKIKLCFIDRSHWKIWSQISPDISKLQKKT